MVDLHAVNQLLYFFLMEDVFKQFHHLGDIQFLDLRRNTFQGSCDGAETMSAAFALAVLVILLAVFQSGDFVIELFDLLFVFSFSARSFSSSGLGVYSIEPPFCVGVFSLVGTE